MNRISGSKLPLYFKCLGAAIIPATPRPNPKRDIAGSRGKALHHFLCRCGPCGRIKALEEMVLSGSEWVTDARRLTIDGTPAAMPESFAYEVSVVWSSVTGQVRLGVPNAAIGEIGGTLDALGVSETAVYVPDYKTGSAQQEAPSQHAQLLFYGMVAAKLYKADRAVLSIIKFDEAGFPIFFVETVEKAALDAFEAKLKRLLVDLAMADALPFERLPLSQGDHCATCDSFSRCPAKATLLATQAPEIAVREIQHAAIPAAWDRVQALRTACDEAERLMREGLRVLGPVQCADGRWLSVQPVEKSKFVDIEGAKRAIEAEYGEGGLASVLEVTESISVGDFDALVASRHRAQHGRKGVGDAKDAARDRLRDLGVLGFTTEYHLKTTTKRPELALDAESEE